MKQILLMFLLIAGVQLNLFSQLTINSNNWKIPVGKDSIGSINTVGLNQYISGGNFFNGEERTWLLDLDLTGMFYEYYQDSQNANFPTASYHIDSLFDVLAANRGVYRKDFYIVNNSGVQVLGYEYDAQSYFIGDLTFGPSDSISIDNYSVKYENPFQLYTFPISNSYSNKDSYVRNLNTRITVAGFGLNDAIASKRSYVDFQDSVIGWGKMNIVYAQYQSGDRDVLVLKRTIQVQDSIFLNNQPAPPQFLGAFNLTQGAITEIYRYIILTNDLSTAMMVVTCTDENMNAASSANFNLGVLTTISGVDNLESSNLSIYPNPTQDFLNVKVEESDFSGSIQILNSLGNVVLEINSVNKDINQRIDISKLNSGIYFIKIGNKVEKFVKM